MVFKAAHEAKNKAKIAVKPILAICGCFD